MQPSIIQSVTPLLFGWEHVSLSVSIADGPLDQWLDEPITGVLLLTDRGPILLDTGPSLANIEKEKSRSHGTGLAATVQIATDSPEDPLVATLHKYARITPQDIAAVALSHLHFDHAGGLHHFASRDVPIFVQQAEHDFAFSPDATPELGYFPDDYRNLHLQWHKIHGDAEILPGLQYLLSPGHTPGNSSFLISLKSGEKILFAFDTADLQRNLDEEIGVGFSVGIPAKQTALPIKRIKQIAATHNAKLYPGHCPTSWPPLLKSL
jgi:N-acyl homoserine lactone hydrolase